jgi:hypothetical protein
MTPEDQITSGKAVMSFARCLLCLVVVLGPVRRSLAEDALPGPAGDVAVAQAPKEPPKKKDEFVGPLLPEAPVAAAAAERTDVANLPRSRSPQFLGDFLGPYLARGFTVTPAITITTTVIGIPPIPTTTITTTVPGMPVGIHVLVPDVFASTIKIADNDSPRPEDRLFLTYNFFQNVTLPVQNRGSFPIGTSPAITFGSGQLAFSRLDLHREVLGFEKTFADGAGSVELRLPLLEVDRGNPHVQELSFISRPFTTFGASIDIAGDNGIDGTNVGDLGIILKYALLNDPETGNVVSIGLLNSVPTGDGVADATGRTVNDLFLEPFLGVVWNEERFYVQAFSSIAAGLLAENPTYWFNDIGVGYWLYQDRCGNGCIKGIVPTLEAHVNTPLSHRQPFVAAPGAGPVVAIDSVDLTAGAHLVFRNDSTLTVGACRSVTGPRPDDFEIIAQFNLRF